MELFYLFLGIPGVVFLFMGIIFLLVTRNTVRPEKHWLTTTGTIVQKEKNYHLSLGKIFNREGFVSRQPDSVPTFQYEIDGTEYETTSKVQQTPGFKIGSTVEVLYNPEDPQQAVINSFLQKGSIFNMIGKILTSLGVIHLLIALFIFIFS